MVRFFARKIMDSSSSSTLIVGKVYARGAWTVRAGEGFPIPNPATGEVVGTIGAGPVDWEGAIDYAKTVGVRILSRMSLEERARMLLNASAAIQKHRKELIALATRFGKTESDAKADLNGAILSYKYYGELGLRLASGPLKTGAKAVEIQGNRKYVGVTVQIVDGQIRVLEDAGIGALTLLPGNVAILIDAFNFFFWGAHHKAAAALLAGTPVVSKPATATCLPSQRLMEILVEENVFPEGTFQFIPGRIDGDVFRHLGRGDVGAFTGSGTVAEMLRQNPHIASGGIRLNVERDSVNAIALGDDVKPDTPVYNMFIQHAAQEVAGINKGERCTKPGRIICRRSIRERVQKDIIDLLTTYRMGNPAIEGVHIGPLTTLDQVADAREGIAAFVAAGATIVHGVTTAHGNFLEPVLLTFEGDALSVSLFHERELFGPFAILLDDGGKGIAQTVQIVNAGGPKLVTAIYTNSPEIARTFVIGTAPYHGRILVVDDMAIADTNVGSFGPGTPWPELLHAIPGEGVELGGIRGVTLFTGDSLESGSDVQGARKFLRQVLPGQGI